MGETRDVEHGLLIPRRLEIVVLVATLVLGIVLGIVVDSFLLGFVAVAGFGAAARLTLEVLS
jgi:hypothetical protein